MKTFRVEKSVTLQEKMETVFEHNWESINAIFLALSLPKSAEHKEQLTKALNLISEAQGIIRTIKEWN